MKKTKITNKERSDAARILGTLSSQAKKKKLGDDGYKQMLSEMGKLGAQKRWKHKKKVPVEKPILDNN